MFAPVLVGVGTAVAMELRRLSTRPPDAKLLDELKGTQKRLTTMIAKLEKDLDKEKSQRAASDARASDLAKATADLKKAQAELTARLNAAESRAAKLTAARDELARKTAALQLEADAARAQLTTALEALKADVAKALAKYAKGGFGKKGAAGLLKALAKAGVDVEATPDDFAALAAAPSSGRVELTVDSASFSRKLRLVTDDPDRIARALAAGTAVVGGARPGIDTARVSLPLRPCKTPPKALLAAAAAAAAKAAASPAALEAGNKLRRPASPPKPPSLESDSPPSSPRLKAEADKPASGGPRFRLKAKAAPAKRAPPPPVPRLGLDVGVTGRADGTHRLDLALDDGASDDLNPARDLALR